MSNDTERKASAVQRPADGELLPCPFCGSPADFRWSFSGEWVTCSNLDTCGIEVFADTFEEAASMWNTRAPTASGSTQSEETK